MIKSKALTPTTKFPHLVMPNRPTYVEEFINTIGSENVRYLTGIHGGGSSVPGFVVFYEDAHVTPCPSCRQEIADAFRFCPSCGAKLK